MCNFIKTYQYMAELWYARNNLYKTIKLIKKKTV